MDILSSNDGQDRPGPSRSVAIIPDANRPAILGWQASCTKKLLNQHFAIGEKAMLPFFSVVFLAVALHYVADVLIGVSSSTYDSEVGLEPRQERPNRMSHLEFFSRVAPFVALVLGVPMGVSLMWH
jgi:hypothetical protein